MEGTWQKKVNIWGQFGSMAGTLFIPKEYLTIVRSPRTTFTLFVLRCVASPSSTHVKRWRTVAIELIEPDVSYLSYYAC